MTPTSPRESTPLSPLVKGVFVIAVVALLVSISLAFRLGSPSHDLGRLSKTLEAQSARLAAIEKAQNQAALQSRSNQMKIGLLSNRLNQLEAARQRGIANGGTAAVQLDTDNASPPNQTDSFSQQPHQRPMYERFQVNQDGVNVWQDDEGRIIAENSDPALTGKIILVEAEDANGNVSQLTVMLPPPKD